MYSIELEPEKIPEAGAAEVIVAGGGPAGVCAAIAAAETGAVTMLIEEGLSRWSMDLRGSRMDSRCGRQIEEKHPDAYCQDVAAA